ncbi:MAG: ferritin family protein [Nitrospinae bacterium]|nr:ferritin family protein [Nitrospinota bacterium]MDA1110435.1 ferritin family protein [Nitrospinota bacterium]
MKEKDSAENSSISFHCIDAIEVSLCIERQGLIFYEKAAKKARAPKVREMFQRLADEEKEHIQSLQTKARFLQPALLNKTSSRKHVDKFIAEQLKGKVFPDIKGSGQSEIPDFQSDVEALDLGIQSEKRSIDVLSELLKKEKKIDVRAIFSHLLVEEKKHLTELEELRKTIAT